MVCPVCESDKNKVTQTRSSNLKVRRRRKCECGIFYTTYEILDSTFLDLVDRIEDFGAEVKQFIKDLEVRT